MGKGPGLYSDIGKRVRDLLNKDYNCDLKLDLTILSEDEVERPFFEQMRAVRATMTADVDHFLAYVTTRLKHKNVTADIKASNDANSSILTTVTVHEPIPGLKTMLSLKVDHLKVLDERRLELQYLHDYAGICASVGLTRNPTVNFSGVLGNDKLVLGSDMSFDTKSGVVTKCDFGACFTNNNKIAALTLNDKGDTLSVSYYHTVSRLTNTVVGAEVTRSFSSNENTITIGTKHVLDPLTTVKARLNSFGKANAIIQYEWIPHSFITFSTEMDIKSIEKRPKIGLALAVVP